MKSNPSRTHRSVFTNCNHSKRTVDVISGTIKTEITRWRHSFWDQQESDAQLQITEWPVKVISDNKMSEISNWRYSFWDQQESDAKPQITVMTVNVTCNTTNSVCHPNHTGNKWNVSHRLDIDRRFVNQPATKLNPFLHTRIRYIQAYNQLNVTRQYGQSIKQTMSRHYQNETQRKERYLLEVLKTNNANHLPQTNRMSS